MALFRLSVGRVTGLATSALLAVAMVPAAVAFASDHPTPAPNPQPATASVRQSAGCQPALGALKTLEAQDRTEDRAEHQANQPNSGAGDQDKTEDQKEKAQMDAAHSAVRQACEPQPTAACLAARNAAKTLEAQDRSEDQAEHQTRQPKPAAGDQDKIEDQTEKAQMDADLGAVRKACEPHR